jgi:hypothetical protein
VPAALEEQRTVELVDPPVDRRQAVATALAEQRRMGELAVCDTLTPYR